MSQYIEEVQKQSTGKQVNENRGRWKRSVLLTLGTEKLFAPVDFRDGLLEDDNVTPFLEELVEECWVTGNLLQTGFLWKGR